MVFVAAFMVLPGMAVWRFAKLWDWRVVALYLVTISLATLVLYHLDKRAAQNRGWRTPETVLHLAEIGGGWVAAYVAQQIFRHKTSKLGYQIIYWSIGFLHQFFALDFLLDWRITRGVFV